MALKSCRHCDRIAHIGGASTIVLALFLASSAQAQPASIGAVDVQAAQATARESGRHRHRRRAWHGPGARAFASQPQRDRTGFDSLRQGDPRHCAADCRLQPIAEVHAELHVLQPERRARRHQEQLARLRRRPVQHHFRRRAVRRRQRSDASLERLFPRRVPVQRNRRSRPGPARARPATRPSAARCRSIPALCPTSSAGR